MAVEQDDERKIILVVDDIPDNILILKMMLGKEHLIRTANSGKAALRAAAVDPLPDLILLDVMMPNMDGYEVCRQLKADSRTRAIPIIFVTGRDEEDNELQGLSLGAVDYIAKPLRPPIVLARIKTHLAMHAAHTQLLELNKTLRDLVMVDGLTGIPNRRRFDEYLEQEWNRALRDKTPISLIVIDIDFFKKFNDNYGHVSGDECLKQIAHSLAASLVRSIDLMARYGGEEFACILPKTDAVGLVMVGNQLRENINALRIPHEYSTVASHITISLGGATLIPSRETLPYLLVGQADARLYKAKEGGRSRLVSE